MADEAGYQIGKKFYPAVERIMATSPVLVERITGLKWSEFVDRMPDDEDEPSNDPIVHLGFVAMAVSQANPTWSHERVCRFFDRVAMEDVETIAPAAEEDEESPPSDAPPATEGETETTSASSTDSNGSQQTSKSGSESRLVPVTPRPSGTRERIT